MTSKEKLKTTGNTLASLGGLSTVFSLTMFKDTTFTMITAILGVILAFAGVLLLQKAGKMEKDES
ncbi:MAG: hypothetical protein KDC44_16255 [Phaeodactylibacter sp.]|nr:hypothetical protein [Phaeodactylibacter sp.]